MTIKVTLKPGKWVPPLLPRRTVDIQFRQIQQRLPKAGIRPEIFNKLLSLPPPLPVALGPKGVQE